MQETATEWVECRCTTEVISGRSWYIARCRKASFEGLSPDRCTPSRPTSDRRAGSSRPMQELVGETTMPSSVITETLPDDPQP